MEGERYPFYNRVLQGKFTDEEIRTADRVVRELYLDYITRGKQGCADACHQVREFIEPVVITTQEDDEY